MRIALCAVQIPFVRGGAEGMFDNLYTELLKREYEVEYIKIPFKWFPPQEIVKSALAWRLLNLTESNGQKIDGVIAQKFPSYLIKHDAKVVWLLHQHRQAYDLAYTQIGNTPHEENNWRLVQNKIHQMDNTSFEEARKIYTISQNVTNRLWRFNQIHGEVLYPPPPLMNRHRCGAYDNYIFYPSRLDSLKRQDLVIKAMKFVHSDLRLKILGEGPFQKELMDIAQEYGVRNRVDFLGYGTDEQLIDLYSNAFCVAYTPLDEDMGFVPMEAFLSKKPVITCSDSGGTLEFVENSKNGYIASPSPIDIAEKINTLYENDGNKIMGNEGYKKIINMNLSWDHVINKLLEPMR